VPAVVVPQQSQRPKPTCLFYELEDLLCKCSHTLDGDREQLLMATNDMAEVPRRIFAIFDSADLRLPMITRIDGTPTSLTKGNYGVSLQSSQRSERLDAFMGMLQTYQAQQHTRAALLSAHVNQRIFYARQRRYASTLEKDISKWPVILCTSSHRSRTAKVAYLAKLHHYVTNDTVKDGNLPNRLRNSRRPAFFPVGIARRCADDRRQSR
jgi:oligoendopeptidase F